MKGNKHDRHDKYKMFLIQRNIRFGQLSKVILPDAKLSVAKTIEAIANEKAKKLNGKLKKVKKHTFAQHVKVMVFKS